tara:strand:+ start:396 stop:1673 length:1278 start_codon:yes stop_codon:yes gene_type:complete
VNDLNKIKIAVIGLGYVGLPLAVEFSKKYHVVGFDTNLDRIEELKDHNDSTLELNKSELEQAKHLDLTCDINILSECNCFIVTVPTPINTDKTPDLSPLTEASNTVGSVLSKNDIVIYESTVYPGATEEICVPILEKRSNLIFNKDFYVGYSPERINPGDKEHRLKDIVKVTSGSTEEISVFIDNLYKSIIDAGTFRATSIAVAEAAKVIENTQRDVNIALINELAMIFNTLDIDTEEVLQAAGSKWNFLSFRPGLVGGHCIGVDPYYLTHQAQAKGYTPEMILSGRKINDNMSIYVAKNLIKNLNNRNIDIKKAKVLILGFTFKENCPDIRNTKIIDIYNELNSQSIDVDVFDPLVNQNDAAKIYNLKLIDKPHENHYDAAIIAVGHNSFKELGFDGISKFLKNNNIIYDLKYVLDRNDSVIRL